MRMIFLKQGSDFAALTERVTKRGGAVGIERLKQLNPHLDFDRLDAGTLVLVPDEVGDAEPVTGAVFDTLAADLKQGLGGAGERIRAGHAQAESERTEVDAVLKSAAFRKVLDADAELARQMADVEASAKSERLRAKEADGALAALDALVDSELAALRRLIG